MAYDIYIIILTAFGMFGIYCFIETLLTFFDLVKMPPSVMIMRNETDENTLKKVDFVQQNVPNNYIVFYPEEEKIGEEKQMETLCNYLESVLGVKSVNNR